MNKERPKLDLSINIPDLTDFYWMKTELQEFCRNHGLSTAGGKMEILKRIEVFLVSGNREDRPSRSNSSSKSAGLPKGPLSMSTVAGEDFRCTREIRDFFEAKVGEGFHFSVALQRYIKSNPGTTFQQIADEWARLRVAKASGEKESIGSQFEYNQFTRDFFADPENNGNTREDCIQAWKEIRSLRGSRKYKSKV
jgi:hypothetical protein